MPNLLTDPLTELQRFFGLNGWTTADVSGAQTPQQFDALKDAATMKNVGTLMAVFGAANFAIGSFYAAKTAQYQERSQASSLQFQSDIDALNAHTAELSAQSIEEAGKTEVMQYTMKAGQEQASQSTAVAARGVDLSSASAIEQRASNELVKQIDVNTISANATRAAWSQRTQATSDRNASLLASTSASNMRASADSISPLSAATASLLGSATGIASQWDWRRRVALAGASSFVMNPGT